MPERRFPPIDDASMTSAQRRVHNAIVSNRGGMGGPYPALLRVPELAERVMAVGDAVRFENVLDGRRMELAIILTARHWQAEFEWYAHSRLASKAGLPPSVLAAVAAGQRPAEDDTSAEPLDLAVYDFAVELLETGHVSDSAFSALHSLVGDAGAVALTATVGYYCLVSAVLNVDRVPAPPSDPPLPPR